MGSGSAKPVGKEGLHLGWWPWGPAWQRHLSGEMGNKWWAKNWSLGIAWKCGGFFLIQPCVLFCCSGCSYRAENPPSFLDTGYSVSSIFTWRSFSLNILVSALCLLVSLQCWAVEQREATEPFSPWNEARSLWWLQKNPSTSPQERAALASAILQVSPNWNTKWKLNLNSFLSAKSNLAGANCPLKGQPFSPQNR